MEVSLANQQSAHAVDDGQLISAVECVLADSSFKSASVNVAVVDDATIHELNRRYLDHDYATDVLSFVLDDGPGHLEGEIVISADTAAAAAAEVGWPAADEQLLYVIHGALHLVGYDDKTPADADKMRGAEIRFLQHFGLQQPHMKTAGGEPRGPLLATGGQHRESAP